MLMNNVQEKSPEIRYMFVYGSLMKNFYNYERYLQGFVGQNFKARVKGKLYHLYKRGYPALINGEEFVYGEVFEINFSEEQLDRIDAMEGFIEENSIENEYNREILDVEVFIEDKLEIRKAYVYKYNIRRQPISDKDIYIGSGNWREFMIHHISE